MPLDRLCNTGLMWIQQQFRNEKEGDQKWRLFISQLNTPPAGVSYAPSSRRVLTKAEQIRAEAEANVGSEGAAFAAAFGS